ncbi:MAG: hypothetical protein AB8H80_18405 [Planctomycetota bacterium]
MRLDPIFLVAPAPKPPQMIRRRAFMLAGVAFAFGAAAGGACGYGLGVRRSDAGANDGEKDAGQPKNTPKTSGSTMPESTGNAELDELRRLAVVAPIEELFTRWRPFLDLLSTRYFDDPVLWGGAKRLGEYLITSEPHADRRLASRWLTQVIEQSSTELASDLQSLIPGLRSVR